MGDCFRTRNSTRPEIGLLWCVCRRWGHTRYHIIRHKTRTENRRTAICCSDHAYSHIHGKADQAILSSNYIPIHNSIRERASHDEKREVYFAAEKIKHEKYFNTLEERPDLRISLSDDRSDGPGTCYCSPKRPILQYETRLLILGSWRPSTILSISLVYQLL